MLHKAKKEPEEPALSAPVVWLKAVYHFHVFHYRMPETVAIAAMTPFVPSPLTVKMAMVAALLQRGEDWKAKQLAPYLPQMKVHIMPPKAAFSFKAFLRYRSVPAVESAGSLDETGSYYPSRPHIREYALLSEDLILFVELPDTKLRPLVEEALRNIRYLGCKDSQVWCCSVQNATQVDLQTEPIVTPLSEGKAGTVVLLADFNSEAQGVTLENLIPGRRKKEHYQDPPPACVLPGRVEAKGRTRVFLREVKAQR